MPKDVAVVKVNNFNSISWCEMDFILERLQIGFTEGNRNQIESAEAYSTGVDITQRTKGQYWLQGRR